MYDKKRNKEELIAKFRQCLEARQKGVFTNKTRGRLLGIPDLPGRPKTRYDFWYDVRNKVRTALIDLQIFLEAADKQQVNQVVTKDTLKPFVKDILSFYGGPDLTRAEIAGLFIRTGFDYLRSMWEGDLTLSHRRTIEEALDLSDNLVERFNQVIERTKDARGRIEEEQRNEESKD